MKSYSIIGFVEILAKILSFFSVIIIAHFLSQEEYGIYNYIVSLVLILSVVMDGGINYFTFDKSLKDELETINKIFNARIYLSALAIFIFAIVIGFLGMLDSVRNLVIYSVTIFFISTISWIKILARGQQLLKIDIITIVIEPLVRLLLLLLLSAKGEMQITELFVLLLISSSISFAIIYSTHRNKLNLSIHQKMRFEFLVSVLRQSKFYFLYYLVWVGIVRVDLIFLEEVLGFSQLAEYSTSFNIYMIVTLFFTSYLTGKMKNALSKGGKAIFQEVAILITVTIIATFFLSEFGFRIIYPSQYWDNYKNFNLVILGLPFFTLSSYILLKFNFYGKSNVSFRILGIIFILKLVGFLFLDLNSVYDYHLYYLIFEVISTLFLWIVSRRLSTNENTAR